MFDQISKLLEQKLSSWVTTPIAWANVPYIPQQDVAYIRQNITMTLSQRINVGDVGYYRDFGLMIIQVFTPRRSGSRVNATMATAIVNMFRGYTSGGLTCVAPFVETVGETKEWYQTNVIVDFYFDNCQP